MKNIEIVLERMESYNEKPAMFWDNKTYSYKEFSNLIDYWEKEICGLGLEEGTVCGVLSEYSPKTCALFFALMKHSMILVPFTKQVESELPVFCQIATVEYLFTFEENENWKVQKYINDNTNDLIEKFKNTKNAGLIVFTSGSTGKPKGILHDCDKVFGKFVDSRKGWRTILFLMMDHFGGFNTFLSSFANGGVGICISGRKPETVCKAIQDSKATLLPTTPTFLNLLIASGAYKEFNLNSVEMITYGTEMMSEATLSKIKDLFPNAQIKQTYGLSELGVLRSKSEGNNSVWVKIGGDGFNVKVIDHILWIKAESNMIGYLNAPNPFNEGGWFCTGDEVEVNGEYIKFMGRKSEVINVGGQKVYPIEIENVLLEADNISEATVSAVQHPIMGQVVQAKVSLFKPENSLELSERLRKICMEKLAKYKVPVRFIIVNEEDQHSSRFKKVRI